MQPIPIKCVSLISSPKNQAAPARLSPKTKLVIGYAKLSSHDLRACIQQSAWIAKVKMPAQYQELPTKLSKLSAEDLSPAIFRQQVAKACVKIHVPSQK